MKSKKLLLTIVSIALVLCTAIAGTYAAFTARDATAVKNTFTFANGITVELKEATPQNLGDAIATGTEDAGFSYTNLVPGQILEKRPYIYVTSTVKSYVFIQVTGLTDDIHLTTPGEITSAPNGWTPLVSDALDQHGNGIYYKVVEKNDNTPKTIFSSVSVINNANANLADDKIVIAVTATQYDGFANAGAAFAQAPAFATVS